MASLLVALAASVVTMLLAAKAHGRQVRLEREAAGHFSVTFGGRNAPFVEALWRRDRVRVWGVAGASLAVLAAWLVAGDARLVWLPRLFAEDRSFGGSLLVVPFWVMTVAFVVAGLLSRRSLARSTRERDARGWWLAVALGAAVTLAAAVW